MIVGIIIWTSTILLITILFIIIKPMSTIESHPLNIPELHGKVTESTQTSLDIYEWSNFLSVVMVTTSVSGVSLFIGVSETYITARYNRNIFQAMMILTLSTIAFMMVLLFLLAIMSVGVSAIYRTIKFIVTVRIYRLAIHLFTVFNIEDKLVGNLDIVDYNIMECLEKNNNQTVNKLSIKLHQETSHIQQRTEDLISNNMIRLTEEGYFLLTIKGYTIIQNKYS